MWLINEHGFLSIVEKPEQEGTGMLTVRGRDGYSVAHLARFLDKKPEKVIIKSSDTDYPFRMIASKVDVARYSTELILAIEYSNFKDRITLARGNVWHDALMNVWSDLLALTPPRVKTWQRKERAGRRARRDAQYDRPYAGSRR